MGIETLVIIKDTNKVTQIIKLYNLNKKIEKQA